MIEKYLTESVMTGWIAERLPGGARLILKGGWVLDERGFRLLREWLVTSLVHLQMPSLDGFQAMEGLMEIVGVALEGGKIIHESQL